MLTVWTTIFFLYPIDTQFGSIQQDNKSIVAATFDTLSTDSVYRETAKQHLISRNDVVYLFKKSLH